MWTLANRRFLKVSKCYTFSLIHTDGKYPQIYKGDPITCAIFIPAWGSNWGSWSFSHNQNNCGSSGVYVTCIYCSLEVKVKHKWNAAQCTKIVGTLVLRWIFAWSAKPEDLQFEPNGWRHHYTGRYTRSEISLVYLWKYQTLTPFLYQHGMPIRYPDFSCYQNNQDTSGAKSPASSGGADTHTWISGITLE